ncbi:hypothetical protein CG51_07675 [Haematobacter missouriensis]|uniref:DUF1311 domain-containing protein n=1 Tax=Haematobacter missouriensis TaxID=366616 RepID=A0ABX3ZUI1_9RHOB|nr:hypothetical protein [Haematobacter missouriensis]KFI29162.1 hypothetical protein CG51_07675 [Haematobacter missouriensis]OWJ74879.1 hypothetical protein CDV53_12310 [Haematobacter missouriensis]
MHMLCLAAAFATTALPALAQTPVTNDLTVTMEPQRYRICNERPERPAWADELRIREAWKAVTLMGLYELRAWENIVSLGNCSCEVRFPDWAAADAEYRERFFDLAQGEQTALRRELRSNQNALAGQVRTICEAQGNW